MGYLRYFLRGCMREYDGDGNKYHLPIYITENGIGLYEDTSVNQVEDDDRIEFMDMHIAAVLKAKEGGCDVRGTMPGRRLICYSLEKRN
ncbi:MAG: family 1 glycosylhydrolase [Enterocloster sp.]